MPADLEQLGPVVLLAPEAGEPRGAAPQDRGHDRDGLHIVHRRRAAIEARTRRERRLEARLALLAFEALDQRGFFAADICARTAMQEHIVIIARTASVLADQPGVVRLVDRLLQRLRLADIFATNVDVGRPRAHREARDQRAFDQLVRIVPHDLAVLARTRLGFVGIDDQEAGPPVLVFLGHEGPLHPGGEARTAATAKAAGLHVVDDRILPLGEQRFGIVPVATRLRGLQAPVLKPVEVGENAVLIGQAHAITPNTT